MRPSAGFEWIIGPSRFLGYTLMSPSDDDDRTVIRPSTRTAPVSEFTDVSGSAGGAEQGEEDNTLPIGSRIAEFEIKALIGTGGFGIVYLAHDHSLGRDVALKEYLPASLAGRTDGLTVRVKSERYAATFAAGLASFINEARLLAQFDSPSLVKVYRFWNANGTAYMVMPFYEGPTLKQALLEMGTPPSEDWLKGLLIPLMGALELLHRENCFHRDIAPDNILLLKGGRPVLLDFGAARRVIEDKAKTLTVILKPGFAPVEQYADMPDMRQGAWTDIYALAAVIHHAIMGKAPAPSVSRIIKDTTVPLEKAAAGSYSETFLKGIDKALAIRPEHRPQSIAELRKVLNLSDDVFAHDAQQRSDTNKVSSRAERPRLLWAALAGSGVLAAAAAGYFVLREPVPSQPARGSAEVAIKPEVTPPAAPPATPTAAPPVAATAPSAAQPTVAAPALPVPEAPNAATVSTASMTDALAQLHENRDSSHAVAVTTDRTKVRIGKDKLRFKIQSDKPGYLYVFMIGTDSDHVNLLFPNKLDANNRIAAGKPLSLPRTGWAMTAGGPPGTNDFIAMVSETPRDFANAGLKKTGAFSEFPKDKVASLLRSSPAGEAVLAGVPVCAAGADCPKAYGAARFSIVEIN